MPPERLCESGIVTGNSFDERVAARYDETIGSWGDSKRHGLFVVEIMLPELHRLPRSET
jgi:hypothetical protein